MNQTDLPAGTIENTQTEMLPYLEMGTGFLIGLSIGYVLKKSFKILLFLTGIALIAVFVLESQGVIQLNETQLQESVSHGMDTFKHFALFLKERLERFEVSSGLSAVAGFFVGLKLG
jgi:uncharacterized membrane protein (Fun14 family)